VDLGLDGGLCRDDLLVAVPQPAYLFILAGGHRVEQRDPVEERLG
jgi:hypothetical protein